MKTDDYHSMVKTGISTFIAIIEILIWQPVKQIQMKLRLLFLPFLLIALQLAGQQQSLEITYDLTCSRALASLFASRSWIMLSIG